MVADHPHLLAVADGVGGWNDVGVDPALFSNELCRNILQIYTEKYSRMAVFKIKLKDIFVEAVKRTKAKGSSTMVMATLDKTEPILETLNLGDSGLILARPVP